MITTETVSHGEYSLTGINAGKYTATIKAVADTEEYLDSENTSKLTNHINFLFQILTYF